MGHHTERMCPIIFVGFNKITISNYWRTRHTGPSSSVNNKCFSSIYEIIYTGF